MYYTTGTTTGESWISWASNYTNSQTYTTAGETAVYNVFPLHDDDYASLEYIRANWHSGEKKKARPKIVCDELLDFL